MSLLQLAPPHTNRSKLLFYPRDCGAGLSASLTRRNAVLIADVLTSRQIVVVRAGAKNRISIFLPSAYTALGNFLGEPQGIPIGRDPNFEHVLIADSGTFEPLIRIGMRPASDGRLRTFFLADRDRFQVTRRRLIDLDDAVLKLIFPTNSPNTFKDET